MNGLEYPAILHSPIGDPLRCIRLRLDVPSWIGKRWIHRSVKRRAAEQARMIAGTKRRKDHPQRWHPPEGRESPREEFMSWRRSSVRYAYPGAMRWLQGKAPPLIGRTRLYDPFAPRPGLAKPRLEPVGEGDIPF